LDPDSNILWIRIRIEEIAGSRSRSGLNQSGSTTLITIAQAIKGIVSRDWKDLQMVSFDRFKNGLLLL
jgi:hypothetical protein